MRTQRFIAGTMLLAVLGCSGSEPLGAQVAGDAAAQREDLAAFQQGFFERDRSYSAAARAEATRRLSNLASRVGTISSTRFLLELSQIAALADNGHTWVRGSAASANRVGIRLAPFGEDFIVLRTVTEHAALLGSKLVAIDGVPIARLRDSAHTLNGGTPAWRDRAVPAFLENPSQLHALGLTRSPTQATYRFQLGNGQTRDEVLGVVPDADGNDGRRPAGMLVPLAPGGTWRSLLPANSAPWALQEFGERMRRRDAPELDAVVIQLRANFALNNALAVFLESADSLRQAQGRRNVVLDMRMNGGGDLNMTRDWMKAITGRLPAGGRVVVLSSPWTFSAAISSIGYLKEAGGERVTIVGEQVGDRLHFWAEGRPITLPHSGTFALMATERHDYVTGCAGFSDCHGSVVRFPIRVPTLEPEVKAPWTLAAYAAGRDPGMEAAAKLLAPLRP